MVAFNAGDDVRGLKWAEKDGPAKLFNDILLEVGLNADERREVEAIKNLAGDDGNEKNLAKAVELCKALMLSKFPEIERSLE